MGRVYTLQENFYIKYILFEFYYKLICGLYSFLYLSFHTCKPPASPPPLLVVSQRGLTKVKTAMHTQDDLYKPMQILYK